MLANTTFALDFQSSRTLSLAQGGRGGALLNDTITLNPSLLGFQPVAALSGTFNWLNNQASAGGAETKTYNVSVIDGKNPYVNAGVSFTRRSDIDFIHVALAKRILPPVSVGFAAKRYATRNGRVSATGNAITGFEAGLSASFALPKETTIIPIQIGLTADNLIHRESDEALVGPKQLGAGIKLNIRELLLVYGDFVENFSHRRGAFASYSGGLELPLGSDLYVRGGVLGFRETGWSAGGGWVGPKLGVSYGYQRKREAAEVSFDHAVTMDIYM